MSPRLIDALLIAFLLIVTLGLRIWQITDSLWLDELHTAWTIRDGLAEIPSRAAMGNGGPLYFGFPWLSAQLFGWSEFSLRLPSLLAGSALVVLTYAIVRRWTVDYFVSLMASLLVAIEPNCGFYALEARCYALVQFIALAQFFVFVELLASQVVRVDLPSDIKPSTWKSRLAVVLVLLSALLVHLHMTTGLFLLVEWTLAIGLSLWRRRGLSFWAGASAFILLLTIPSWWLVIDVYSRRDAWSAFVKIPQSFGAAVNLFPVTWTVGTVLVIGFGYFLGRLTGAIGSAEAAANDATADSVNANHERWVLRTVAVACCFAATIFLAWSLTRYDIARLFFRRYLMSVAVFPMLAAALILVRLPKNWRWCAAATTVLVALVNFGPIPTQLRLGTLISRPNEDWRRASRWLRDANAKVVLVDSGLIESNRLRVDESDELRDYCSLPLLGLYQLGEPTRLVPMPRDHSWEDVAQSIRQFSSNGVWFISRKRGLEISRDSGLVELERQLHGRVTTIRLELVDANSQ